MLDPSYSFTHSVIFAQCLLLSAGDPVVNETGENSCSHGAYLLVGKADNEDK